MMKRIEVIRKHKATIDDLVQVGVVDPRILQLTEVYEARKSMTEKETAKAFKCSVRTVSRYINYLNTEI